LKPDSLIVDRRMRQSSGPGSTKDTRAALL
jgi:hypothetical protein